MLTFPVNLDARAREPPQNKLDPCQEVRSRGPPSYGFINGSAAGTARAAGAPGGIAAAAAASAWMAAGNC